MRSTTPGNSGWSLVYCHEKPVFEFVEQASSIQQRELTLYSLDLRATRRNLNLRASMGVVSDNEKKSQLINSHPQLFELQIRY